MFRVSQHPSSGVLKTVPAASSTGHTTCTATPLQRGLIGTESILLRMRNVKIVKEIKKRSFCSIIFLFFENHAVYEKM